MAQNVGANATPAENGMPLAKGVAPFPQDDPKDSKLAEAADAHVHNVNDMQQSSSNSSAPDTPGGKSKSKSNEPTSFFRLYCTADKVRSSRAVLASSCVLCAARTACEHTDARRAVHLT